LIGSKTFARQAPVGSVNLDDATLALASDLVSDAP
jgi:hypothetical protein